MYDQERMSQKKHHQIAQEMSAAICQFTPDEQNEVVKIIYDTIYENRQARIDEAEKGFIHLKDTMIQLQGKENPRN